MAAVPAREASESAISRAPQRALNAIGPAAQTDATKAHFERHPQLRAQTLSMFPLHRLGDIRDDIGCDRGAVQRLHAIRDRPDHPGRRRSVYRALASVGRLRLWRTDGVCAALTQYRP